MADADPEPNTKDDSTLSCQVAMKLILNEELKTNIIPHPAFNEKQSIIEIIKLHEQDDYFVMSSDSMDELKAMYMNYHPKKNLF